MKYLIRSFAFLVLCCATVRAAEPAPGADPNDSARFLAGLPPSEKPPLAALANDASWKQHAKFFDAAWSTLEKRQLSKIHEWAAANLKAPKPVCYYMFSGPDYLYADAFFPSATTYVLCGLEPIGHIPDAAKMNHSGAALQGLEKSLNSVLSFSFFKTKDMHAELHSNQFDGTLPLLYVFLARSGKTIHEVSLVGLDKDGTEIAENKGKGVTPGTKIVFSSGDGAKQSLYYFTTDLSNEGVAHSGFLKFCEQFGEGDAMVKSASYLMHNDGFSKVRRFLLDHSATLVEDDSGIPISHFEAEKWNLQPFGKYLGPINLFPGTFQPKLKALFDTAHPEPLDFGIGYRWYPHQSNWIVATRKDN